MRETNIGMEAFRWRLAPSILAGAVLEIHFVSFFNNINKISSIHLPIPSLAWYEWYVAVTM